MTPSELEQAYRNLMMENIVLTDSNERLHQRLARLERGLEESPAAKQLIRAQRNALAERSHRLRQLEYQNKQLQREQKRIRDENRRLRERLERLAPGQQEQRYDYETCLQELAEARAALRRKDHEMLDLTDRYYRLQADRSPVLPSTPAANGEF